MATKTSKALASQRAGTERAYGRELMVVGLGSFLKGYAEGKGMLPPFVGSPKLTPNMILTGIGFFMSRRGGKNMRATGRGMLAIGGVPLLTEFGRKFATGG